MKTFETEKHNIPEGATHYKDATEVFEFCWFKIEDGNWHVMTEKNSKWYHSGVGESLYIDEIKPIPQTKEVEWENGLPPVGAIYTVEPHFNIELLCKYSSKYVVVGEMLPKETYKGMEVVLDIMEHRDRTFRKPETEAERIERKRDEAIHAMVDDFTEQDVDCNYRGKVAKVCAALYDAGYRKPTN